MVRDGWFSYKQYQQCRHSLCNAHLLRDLTFIGETEPSQLQWTVDLAELLLEIKESVETARSQERSELDDILQKEFLSRYDSIMALAEQSIRGSPQEKTVGLSAQKLLNRFVKNKTEILCFMFDFSVPFDNNGSERDLRMLKLQQKISGCFRTTQGATTFCRVRSYLASVRKQGGSLLTALEQALKGKPRALAN